MKKRCSKCRKQKSVSAFYKHRLNKDGLQRWCKSCIKFYRQKYYQLHKTEHKRYKQEHRKTIIGGLRERFQKMRYRCNNPKDKRYNCYGGRGIKCLFSSPDEFVNYVLNELKIDPRGLDVDRIDNNGHYEPGNIRFVTHKENCNNRKRK